MKKKGRIGFGGKRVKGMDAEIRAAFLALSMTVAMVLAGCGASGYNGKFDTAVPQAYAPQVNGMAGGSAYSESYAVAEEMGDMADMDAGFTYTDGGSGVTPANVDRKLIRTVHLSVETKEFDTMMTTLSQQVSELGGYIENMDTYNGSAYSGYRSARNASMTIRIPKNGLDSFLDTVSDISNVVSRSENVEDVTLTYVDMESRRDMLKVEQERLLAFLEQAESIEDIITIESRLSTVRYQLESMESQLRTFDNQVDYSTVYLNISEVKELTPVEEKNGWQRMTEGFTNSLKSIGNGIKEFGIWFVIHIPYLVVWALVIGGIVLIIRVLIKSSLKKRAKRREAKKQEAVSRGAINQEGINRESIHQEGINQGSIHQGN